MGGGSFMRCAVIDWPTMQHSLHKQSRGLRLYGTGDLIKFSL